MLKNFIPVLIVLCLAWPAGSLPAWAADATVDDFIGEYSGSSISSTEDSALINHLSAIDPTEVDETDFDLSGDVGLLGGHFDLDTSTLIYPLDGHGSTSNHTHEWDDKTGQTGVDYFNIVECSVNDVSACVEDPSLLQTDPDFDQIDTIIADPTQRFIVIVANDRLSTGGIMEINGTSLSVVA